MFHVVLLQPEIPPNTGNVIRLCANIGATLHLVEPLGFPIDHARMRRAGLDYHEMAEVRVHPNWDAFVAAPGAPALDRAFAVETVGPTRYDSVRSRPGDGFVFGSETGGIDRGVLAAFDPARRLRLPMRPHNRSLNLSNAVAVVVFEAWRQTGFEGGR
ncbi:MAG: tRNA (cytidine(34)-2'-O)-methyltransferase [Burkholderiales bacterium]|nr:MAG: tRNA (cytidine(34)-2'-O)-methyltransferase [Burkholderiales bacterium]